MHDSISWQERVRGDADWIHNRIWNDRNRIELRRKSDKNYTREINATISGASIGIAIGAGVAALESLANKEHVRFLRLASYAGCTGTGCAIVNSWFKLGERDISQKYSYEIKHMNSIRNLLADALGEDALKGQHQWYELYQKIKDDPILNSKEFSTRLR